MTTSAFLSDQLGAAVADGRTVLITHAAGADPLPLLYVLASRIPPMRNTVTVHRGLTGRTGRRWLPGTVLPAAVTAAGLAAIAPQLPYAGAETLVATEIQISELTALLKIADQVATLGTLALPDLGDPGELGVAEHLIQACTAGGLGATTAQRLLATAVDHLAHVHHRRGGIATVSLYTPTLIGDVLQLAEQAPPQDVTDLVRALHHSPTHEASDPRAAAGPHKAFVPDRLAPITSIRGASSGHLRRPGADVARRARRRSAPPEKRFFTKVVAGDGDCWIWTGSTSRAGDGPSYGLFVVNTSQANRQTMHAHRWAYELLRAEIPPGLVLTSRCGTTLCVNPWHMDPVPRRFGPERRTHCPRGHDYAVYGVKDRKGRRCKRCAADAAWARRRAEGRPTRRRTMYG